MVDMGNGRYGEEEEQAMVMFGIGFVVGLIAAGFVFALADTFTR